MTKILIRFLALLLFGSSALVAASQNILPAENVVTEPEYATHTKKGVVLLEKHQYVPLMEDNPVLKYSVLKDENEGNVIRKEGNVLYVDPEPDFEPTGELIEEMPKD